MRKCPWCGKEYPDEAKVCALDQNRLVSSSGEPIAESEPEAEEIEPVDRKRSTAERDIMVGGGFFVGGLVVTAATYTAASSRGGTYIVAWGAILFGGLQFLRGLSGMKSIQQSSPEVDESDGGGDAQSLLTLAARLESVDREKAVAKYKEVIALFPGTSASAEAERNIQTLMSYKESAVM